MTAETIVVDALSVHMGGGASYLTRQLAALGRVAPERNLVVLAATWNEQVLRSAVDSSTVVRGLRVGNLATRLAFQQLCLPRYRGERTVLYCPGNLTPLVRSHLPVVLALQNPNMVGPGPCQPHNRRWRRRAQIEMTRRSLRRADRVVVISEALRDDVLGDGLVGPERLRVVPSGAPPVSPGGGSAPDGFPFDAGQYFLVLANDAPHKRHDHVIESWSRAWEGTPEESFPGLVIAGHMSQARRSDQRALVRSRHRSQLLHLGAVDQPETVDWLLRNAAALVASSTLEAHPLTPAEAGAVGCPVVLSDIPAHREVARDHAVYVPTDDVAALTEVLKAIGASGPGDGRTCWEWPVSWEDNARMLLAVFDELVP